MESPKIRRALISVSDKRGIVEFARGLAECGVEILSTGGTASHLRDSEVSVIDISDYTGFPEILDGRVKTLHPKVFSGILARRDNDADESVLEQLDIGTIELVVVNLYPFEETIKIEGVTEQQVIEQIDIGGPSLLRAAGKNYQAVTVATSPDQYSAILGQVQQNGRTSLQLRRELMIEVFRHTAKYDSVISEYFLPSELAADKLPLQFSLLLKQEKKLRYGENSHQLAAVYSMPDFQGSSPSGPNLIKADQLHGKELSYNNLLDLDAAIGMMQSFADPACCVLKHSNPCGAAIGKELKIACEKAFACDPLSAFGSVLGFNRELDAATAEFLSDGEFFIEAILAPSFSQDAIDTLTTKPKWRANVRLVEIGPIEGAEKQIEFRQIRGGFLVQDVDPPDRQHNWKTVTDKCPTPDERTELEFAWNVVRHVKSNAIVLSKDNATVGIGAGQMSRVDSVEIAISKAAARAAGSVLASDAFFPFADSIERAAAAGIKAIVQPGGSKRDDEVIEACNKLEMAMTFTSRRHFRH